MVNAMHKELEALRDQLRYAAENAERAPMPDGYWVSSDFVAVMADKLDALLREGGWQSIDSAPKDGTPFIGWSSEYGQRETHWRLFGEGSSAKQRFDRGEGPSGSWEWSEPQSNWGSSWSPTHWQPRQEPPALTGYSR